MRAATSIEQSSTRHGPVKVLFVQPFAHGGGSENVLLRLAGDVDRTRVEPVILLMEDGPLSARVAAMGLRQHTVELPGKLSLARFPAAARKLAAWLAAEGIDVIHANGTKAAMLSAFIGPKAGIPVLWMKHGHDFDRWAPRVLGPRCDRIACGSRAVAAAFPERLSDRIFVCTPGVALADPTPVRETGPVIVSVGRMDPLKGFDELIRATALLRERGVPARLKLAGHSNTKSPGYASELRRMIDDLDLGDSVALLGVVDSLDELYEEARVVALASRRARRRQGSTGAEGTPLVLLEGMSFGRPVVAPDDGGIAEITGDAGTLVEAATAPLLADALAPYLRDPELAAEVGKRGRARVQERYTVPRMIERFTAEYELLARREKTS
jgi:glycosyltransferase involved in cell wall biosynthesis